MISLLLALAAQGAPADLDPEARYRSCTALIKRSAESAVATADQWRLQGGGLPARQCLGLAYVALERWPAAATAFEQAAAAAENARDARAADFWVQAGNAWLAAGDAAKARTALNSALAATTLAPELRGEAHLDRARAAVALDDLAAARADIDKGLELVPADPFAWYLSAALARRQNDLPRAQEHIAKAVSLAPDDAAILLEAGNIAGVSGDTDAAAGLYQRAASAAPNSEAGQAASAALGEPAPAAQPR